jgi:anti-sigma regulatory factor (Ser/Thr protein kinase)
MLHHPGFVYRDHGQYVAGTTRFVRSAVDAGEPVLVAVPGPRLGVLRDALADVSGAVTFADMAVAGRNPGRIIPGVLLRFAGAHPGRRVAIVGEPIWPGRTADEYPACVTHEALINAVFADRPASILCPYDAAGLSSFTLADAYRTHPVMIDGDGAAAASPLYADPLMTAAEFDGPLPPPPPDAVSRFFRYRTDLAGLREIVHKYAGGRLPGDRADEVVLAAHELATNTVRHTGAGGFLRLWTEPGRLVCQVEDAGPSPGVLAGRVPPELRSTSGRGLILVNQLCDLVRIHRHPAGTTIRVHIDLV